MQAVLDTTVASILFNGGVLEAFYLEQGRRFELVISFQTAEEMFFGAYKNSWGEHRLTELQDHLLRYPVVPGTWELARQCARVRAEAERLGRRLEPDDAWIVATAVYLGLPLITDDNDQVIPGLTGYRYISRHGVSP